MKCLIIEDEAPAQRILQRFIADAPGLELIATENNALSALTILEEQAIDLLFLDINLPKLTGIELLRTLRHPPHVILTTAYPDYALESYELDVTDYLLKPFSFARFLRAVRKVPTVVSPTTLAPRPHLFVRADKVTHRIEVEDLLYVKAEGDFVKLVLRERNLLIGQTLAHFERLLQPHNVIRVHRSYLLHLPALQKLEGNQAHTAAGIVPIGRTYRPLLLAKLEGQ